MASVLSAVRPPSLKPILRSIWGALGRQSRYVLGGGYALAAMITAAGVLLASNGSAGSAGATSSMVLGVLGLNLVLILGLCLLMAGRVMRQINVEAGGAGARLHLRFITLFSMAAVAPAVIVALFFG
ncbi:MAG: PAS domain-containing sensor histidine kinase, partial [Caulobacterales bacterium]|nr:PAS domain-containing sensor histidine kinase [Caulobacterales bacterium]